VYIFDIWLFLKLKCGIHKWGLGPDTCFMGSHLVLKYVLTGGSWILVRG
jgi:hypothetical protein